VRGWLYDLLPPMRYFRHAAIFRCFYLFTMLVLAMLAAGDLDAETAGRQARGRRRLAVVAAVMAAVGLLTLAVVCKAAHLGSRDLPTAWLAGAHGLLVWAGTAALAIVAWRMARGPQPFAFGRLLLLLAVLDAVLSVVLSKPTMYSNRRMIWPEVEAAHVPTVDLTRQGLARLPTWTVGPETQMNACLVGKVPVLHCFNVLRSELYEATMASGVLAAAASGENRIWFAPQASREPFDQTTCRRLAARAGALGRPCIVVSDPTEVTGLREPADLDSFGRPTGTLERLPPAVPAPVRLMRYDGRHLDFDVTCPAQGWLLVSDRWAPGWQAWVNDRPTRVWLGNLVFRALPVQGGENRVRFLYAPFGYPWLLACSWGVLGLVCVASIWVGMTAGKRRGEMP
jgi:hypothetical protein